MLYQQALNGVRGMNSTRLNYGRTASKFLSGMNRNARRVGVGARHLSDIASNINSATGNMLERNSDVYNKGQKVLKTIGKLASDSDMNDPKMAPYGKFVRQHLGYRE